MQDLLLDVRHALRGFRKTPAFTVVTVISLALAIGANGFVFAVFKTADIEIGLTSLPWIDEPLVLLDTDDIEASRRALVGAGAIGLGEVADGSLAPLGTAPVTNGDPETGIVDVPGARLAVVELANGSKIGLRQSSSAA